VSDTTGEEPSDRGAAVTLATQRKRSCRLRTHDIDADVAQQRAAMAAAYASARECSHIRHDRRLATWLRVSTRTISLPLVLAAFAVTTACTGDPTESNSGFGDPDGAESSSTGGPSDEPTDTNGGSTGSTTSAPSDLGTTSGEEEESTGTPTGLARIRLVHAAAGAPNLDVYFAGSEAAVITDLAYGGASDYADMPAGSLAFEIRAAGTPAGDPPVYVGAFELDDESTVTAVAAGIVDSADEANAFRVLSLVEEFEDPGEGNAAIRFVNAGADATEISIDVDHDGAGPELSHVDRFADSGAAGVPLQADAAVQLGIITEGEELTAFTSPALAEGGHVFLIAAGMRDDLPRQVTGLGLLAVGPDGVIGMIRQNPIFYSLHASPDSGRFDVCIDGIARAVGHGFGEIVRIQLPPGGYDLEYFSQGSECDGEPENMQASGELVAGEQYLMVSAGEIVPENGDQLFHTTPFVEAFPLDEGSDAVFSVIHAGSAPPVDFGTLDDGHELTPETLLVADLEWGEQSEIMMLPANQYDVGFVPASVPLPAAPYGVVPAPMDQGTRAWMIAAGAVTPQGYDYVATVFTVVTSSNPWVVVPLDD